MKRFLFYYYPGARGDFLASILTDRFKLVNSFDYKVAMPVEAIKIHPRTLNVIDPNIASRFPKTLESYEQMFAYCKQLDITAIRILLPNLDDMYDAIFLT